MNERFVNAVTLMRKLQKEFFRTKSMDTLAKAKEAERQVDTLLKDILSPNLFDS